MGNTAQQLTSQGRSNADAVYAFLHDQIVALKLLPGTKISEAEISKQLKVSRQPVREAFIRLADADLVLVRPQKATVVRKFSMQRIDTARFIRLAVESHVLREACVDFDARVFAQLDQNLSQQNVAIEADDAAQFHQLDYAFHQLLCALARRADVYSTIIDNKQQIDRLCLLSLSEAAAMPALLADHVAILAALKEQNADVAVQHLTCHLSRLDDTIADIRRLHPDYFEIHAGTPLPSLQKG